MRFRHLHMHPRDLDSNYIVSGALIKEGQPIGTIGNYDRRPGLTSTHLHFELQVPTRDGFVRVNPYMTLIASYEHLINARGTEYVPAPAPEIQGEVQNPVAVSAEHTAPAVVAVSTAVAGAKIAAGEASKDSTGAKKKKARVKDKRKAKSRSARHHPTKKRRAS